MLAGWVLRLELDVLNVQGCFILAGFTAAWRLKSKNRVPKSRSTLIPFALLRRCISSSLPQAAVTRCHFLTSTHPCPLHKAWDLVGRASTSELLRGARSDPIIVPCALSSSHVVCTRLRLPPTSLEAIQHGVYPIVFDPTSYIPQCRWRESPPRCVRAPLGLSTGLSQIP